MFLIKGRYIAILLLLIINLIAASKVTFCQNTNIKLTQQIATFDSEAPSTLEQMIELGQRFHISLGIELMVEPGQIHAKPIHLHNMSLEGMIKKILERQTISVVELNNRVINVSTSSLISDPNNFLNFKIAEFKIEKGSLLKTSFYLRHSIEQQLNPTEGWAGGYGGGSPNDEFNIPKITLFEKDLSVRQILNEMIAQQGDSLWIVLLSPSNKISDGRFYAPVSRFSDDCLDYFNWDLIPLTPSKPYRFNGPSFEKQPVNSQ